MRETVNKGRAIKVSGQQAGQPRALQTSATLEAREVEDEGNATTYNLHGAKAELGDGDEQRRRRGQAMVASRDAVPKPGSPIRSDDNTNATDC